MPTLHKTTLEAGEYITRNDFHWGSTIGDSPGAITFGFRTSIAGYTVAGHDISRFSPLTAAEQQAVRQAFALFAEVANIIFTDLGSTNSAALLFSNYRDQNDGSAAFAFYPSNANTAANSSDGDVFINDFYTSTTSLPSGSYDFATIVHEIGHAIGLQHPGDYNAAPGVKITYDAHAEYVEDSNQYSLMSYFEETNTGANYLGFNPETPMLHDIAALQRLYGTNNNTRTGNSTYGFNSNAGTSYTINSSTERAVFTVWDTGGLDAFDFSGYSQAQTIDLNAESFSSVGGLINNIAVARNVTIESAFGGSGRDTITGNSGDNTFRGNGGDDTIDGAFGNDSAIFSGLRSAYTLTALSGNGVRVTGPDGNDTLTNVELLVFSDQTVEWRSVSGADDFADSLTDTGSPFGLITLNATSTGNLEAVGDRDWFRVQLTAGSSYIFNLQGQPTNGGTLPDPYLRIVDSAGIIVAENDDLAPGTNTDSRATYVASSSGTHYVVAGAFNDGFSGTYTVGLTGTAPADDFADSLSDNTAPIGQLTVNVAGTGRLETTAARDWFSVQLTAGVSYTISLRGQQAGGGTLEDPYLRLYGSGGIFIAQNDDIVLGTNRDSELTYIATTTGTYYISAAAFDDDYTGTYTIDVAGIVPADDFADSLVDLTSPIGSISANDNVTGRIEETGDRDWFAVQLTSGLTYTFSLQGQQAGAGTLEDPYLRLHDSAGTLLAENDDIVLGINRDSVLTYAANTTGVYYVQTGAFDDDYTGSYRLSVSDSSGLNNIFGTVNADKHLVGTAGNDRIDGLAGADRMAGLDGDDIYVMDNKGDKIAELVGGGIDAVETSVTVKLGRNVENVTLTGNAAINATGNNLDNIITGNNAGSGGTGNNILDGTKLGNDTFVFAGSFGNDTIKNFVGNGPAVGDTIQFDNAIFANFEALTAPGVIEDLGKHLMIHAGTFGTIRLDKVDDVTMLNAQDFTFV
jgi:serralysin